MSPILETWIRRLLIALLVSIACTPATGIAQRRLSPGLHDLVVYDSGQHEQGLPAVNFTRQGGGVVVEIPPAVHVHRFYYSGDKEVQGPIIQGGPTIVVATHPKTGKQMYVDATLPAGAPKIAYDKNSITYVYPDQRVVVKFQHFPFDPEVAVVKYHRGRGTGRRVGEFAAQTHKKISQSVKDSALIGSLKNSTQSAGQLLTGAKETVGTATSQFVDQLNSGLSLIPGVAAIRSAGQQSDERKKRTRIENARRVNERNEIKFAPTIR